MPTAQDYAAQDQAYSKQYDEQQAAKAQQEAQAKQPPSMLQQWTSNIGRVSGQMIDSAVSAADSLYETPAIRKARDATAGLVTGATNIADTVMSHAAPMLAQPGDEREADEQAKLGVTSEDLAKAGSQIWDHAKGSILDFRDAVAVQDPTMSDSLIQGVAQLAVPFAGYSRMLGGLGFIANTVASGALTDATALGPHDARMADLIALGRHTEGKLGDVLRTLAPDGSATNAYIEYLADRGNESEAEGRFKNVLDGLGANLIATPLIHTAANVLKQGTAGLRYMIENGVGSAGDIVATPKAQRGAIGDLSQSRPSVRANNASGESAASLEAQSWVRAQKTSGVKRLRLDPDAEPQPLMGIEGRDPRTMTGHPVIDLHPDGTHELIDRGNMTKMQAEGLVARFKARNSLGSEEGK